LSAFVVIGGYWWLLVVIGGYWWLLVQYLQTEPSSMQKSFPT
jgi:hypothetical protein